MICARYLFLPMLPQSASSIRAPVPAERIIPFFRQLLRSLHSLHSIGVWHEDLKPANILMTETGMPVLADFGLTTFSPRLKRACSGGGTLDYMSPEKIEVGVWAHSKQYHPLQSLMLVITCIEPTLRWRRLGRLRLRYSSLQMAHEPSPVHPGSNR
jgi:serine/threonine protein kinase